MSQDIRKFKIYYPKKGNKVYVNDGLDKSIDKIEGKLGEKEQQQDDGNYQQRVY